VVPTDEELRVTSKLVEAAVRAAERGVLDETLREEVEARYVTIWGSGEP